MVYSDPQVLQERTYGPPGKFDPAHPTAPAPLLLKRDRRVVGYHGPEEMEMGFEDTREDTERVIFLCPVCGSRRVLPIESALDHDLLCNGSTILYL